MIDINELRRLTQAATPGPWVNYGRQPSAAGLPYSAVAAKTLLTRVYSEAYGDVEQETANAEFIAAANPAAVSELLDRLEVAETDAAHQKTLAESALRVAEGWERKCGELRAALRHEADCVEAAKAEIDALRSKITEMERQEPVGKFIRHPSNWLWEQDGYGDNPDARPLYALPGAQAQPAQKAVAYLDLGVGGYVDVGTDLADEALAALPKGRHMLGIVGTYGVDGYVPAQPSPSVPECPYPCGWRNLLKLAIEDGAYLARSINTDEPVTENARAVTMRIVLMLRDVLMAINNAAPEAKP